MPACRDKKLIQLIKKMTGFSLLEVMLASALGLLLFGLLLNVYLAAKHSLAIQKALNDMADHARLVASILTDEVHKAGSMGCPRLTADFPLTNLPPFSLTMQNRLTGTKDYIRVRYADMTHAVLARPMQAGVMDTLYTSGRVHFSANDILMIADCSHAEIFRVKQVSMSRGLQIITTTSPLHATFSVFAEIGRLVINKYFIARSHHPDNEAGNHSLFVENIFHRKTELLGGVHQMHILYSVLVDGQIIDLPARAISDWSKVMGVAFDLELVAKPFKKHWYIYSATYSSQET